MSLFRPTELIPFLASIGKRPSRALSQNFLIDGNILNKIASLADIKPGDYVLEIGSGPGALTEKLLERGSHVVAVEKDRVFASALNRLQTKPERLQVIEGDFLELDLKTTLGAFPPLKVVANIPYHITTPIILSLIQSGHHIESITLMVQREVALRLTAKKGTADYCSLTLLLEHHAHVSFGFNIEPTCFYPPPNVRSATIHMKLKTPSTIPYPEQMIRAAFQQRRKMVRTSLRKLYPDIDIAKILVSLRINPDCRPEELSLTEFLHLNDAFTHHRH